ncbi:hypothetical protein IMSAGC003_03736 [Lachnospiraceae bacterium]|nr:hypothetical protein IMSAGC003_03736 [Lachnospiraceae bacterium]
MRKLDKSQGFDAFCATAEQFATCMDDNLFVYDIMFFKKPEMLKNRHFRLFLFLVCF